MPSHTVHVALAGSPYDIHVDPGLLTRAGALIASLSPARRVAMLTDSQIGPLHAAMLQESLRGAGIETIVATLPAGEDHKTLATLLPIYEQFLAARIERSTPLLALGGGVVGDMAGFLAATLLRGIPFIQIPTTLLAMVDASVGGKTGVNAKAGKNLIGAFHQPIAVLIDPELLRTLPPRELRGGLAECIKHDLIRDATGFSDLQKNIARALQLDIPYLTDLIAHNVAIKARVVEADPHEKAERAHLNFGHTFGHAIETVSHYAYSHGESVALGMAAAAFTSHRLGLIDDTARRQILAAISAAGLPTGGMTLDPSAVVSAMHFDKKVHAGKIRFVLLDRIGHAVIRDNVPSELVQAAIESLRG